MIGMPLNLDISFVILTWNSDDFIGKCLQSIEQSLAESPFSCEVLIVDNGSADDTIPTIEQMKGAVSFDLDLICLPENMGTTYPRNLAMKKACGRFICVMDSDVTLFPGVLEKLISNLDHNSRIGLAAPRILYPSGKLQKSVDKFPTLVHKAYRYFFLKRLEEKEGRQAGTDLPVEVDYAISALWLMKKQIIDTVGLLDEKIFYAPEDVDFCLRVWKHGYTIEYDPTVSVIHHTQEISRGFKFNAAFRSHLKGLLYYFLKHRYFLTAPKLSK